MAIPLLVVACGDDGEEAPSDPLTCEWLAGDNCWKQSVSAARECAPGGEATGTLSADGKTCTFADGTVINFAKPVDPAASIGDAQWDFTIVRGGSECASFRETEGDDKEISLTTSLGTFTERVDGASVTMACPDDATYSGSAFALLQCENAFSILPGTATSSSGTTVAFSLVGAGDSAATLFSCASAEPAP